MRDLLCRRLVLAVAALAVGALTPCWLVAQGMGRGGMPSTGPGALFKKEQGNREIVGLSLAATDEPVVDVRIVGNKLIPTEQILNEMQTRVGRPYDPALLQRDVRKLTSRSWFVAVKTKIDQTPDGRIVTIEVAERPTIRYLQYLGNDVNFLGTGGIRDKKLAKETGLKVGGSVDPYAVEEARRKIVALYRKNGFNQVQVTILEGNKPTDQGIVFLINEGTPQKIWKVEFEGNTFASDARLRTQIESKRPTAWIFKGYCDRELIDADVRRLEDYYRAFGYFGARVGRKLEYNANGQWVTLRFVIHEGLRYQVRNVAFMGNRIFANTSLGMLGSLPPGQLFEQAKMNRDVRSLKELYGSQGYVFADINAELIYLEQPGQVDLVYHIDEGKQWRVGRIFVHIDGDNPHTRIQTALNRLSIRPGQIVDIREIHASERRLQASSLFMSDPVQGIVPKITYRIQDLDAEQLAQESGGEFRGQSPDPYRTSPPVAAVAAPQRMYAVPLPPGYVPGDDAMDVHLQIESPPSQYPTAPASAEPLPTSSPGPSSNPYQSLVIRTQSPYQPATTQSGVAPSAYAQVNPGAAAPAAAYVAQGYGGQAVRATGPESTPVGYGAQDVAPAQYSEPLPPGTMFGPPPQPTGTPMAGPPTGGPPTGVVPDPSITPLPANPQLFPSGAPEPWARPFEDPSVDIFVNTNETQTGRLMLGVAVNSDAGLFGQILLDEQNFNYRRWPSSMEDVVSGRAWRGAGQRFRLEAMPGTQVQRYIMSFQEPYLMDTPISLGLSGSFFDRRFEDWSEQRLGGRVSLGYQWTADDVSAAISYRGENIKIYDPVTPPAPVRELDEVIGDNILHGFKFTLANDTRDSAFFATSGHYAELSFEQVVGSFSYPRAMLDIRQYGLLTERPDHSGRHVLSFSTQLGFTGQDTPIYDRFFAGGISFRGFDFHSVSPIKSGVEVGGDFQWINTLEYLFPLTADDMLHGVVFMDFGTVEENVNIDWSRFRAAPGFGMRITIPAMGPAPIALDFAFPIASARTDDEQLFTFNIGFNR